MAYRKFVLIGFLLFAWLNMQGQEQNYQHVDSATYAMYLASDWRQLIDKGRQAEAEHMAFPLLYLRVGYAYFKRGNYSAALKQYVQVLKADSYNQTAHYYSYLCNLYLNRMPEAYFSGKYLDTADITQPYPLRFAWVQVGVESGFKSNTNRWRGNAVYNRLSSINRLGWRLQLDQSVVYFNQPLTVGPQVSSHSNDEQWEYYGNLTYTLNSKWSLIGAYHYLHTTYFQNTYQNHIVLAGAKYAIPFFTLQADANLGTLTGSHEQQYNLQASVFPLGNLNFYSITRGSLLNQNNSQRFIFGQTAGLKVFKNFWTEGAVVLGNLDNYLESNGLYVYNSIDKTEFKTGGTSYYQLNDHLMLYVNYTYEQKQDAFQRFSFQQHSITGGLTWKF